MSQSDENFVNALDRFVRVKSALRPDLLLAEVACKDWYLVDVEGGLTDEDPPLAVTEDTEPVGIDEYLGVYLPEERRIKVFRKNIEHTSKRLNCKLDVLGYVVHYHEQAHAIIHLGVTQEERKRGLTDDQFRWNRLSQLTSWFHGIEHELHEHLAQLLTYHALLRLRKKLRDISAERLSDDLLDTYTRLLKYQPSAYRVDRYHSVPLERVIGSISLIRNGDLVGKIEPWRTIMQWE